MGRPRAAELGPEPLLEQSAWRRPDAEDLLLEDARHPRDGADGDQDAVGVDDRPVLDEPVLATRKTCEAEVWIFFPVAATPA